MRRLIIELDTEDAAKLVGERTLRGIEYMEALSFLKEDPQDFAGIFKIKFKNPKTKLKDFSFGKHPQVQQLERGKDGSYTFYYRGRPGVDKQTRKLWKEGGGYLSTPYEIRDNKLKLTFLGSGKEMKSIIRFLRKIGIRYNLKVLTDARFSRNSPLSRLTDKQRSVITTAFNHGYYDIPRKIGSTELGKSLGIGNPAFVMHRRKAERRIMAELLSESH